MMNSVHFIPMPTKTATALQNGGLDANGQRPERHISDGDGVPCRHCLEQVQAGEPYLILAYRPFPEAQPYAELGPIFLHAESCPSYVNHKEIPPMLLNKEHLLIRGYNDQNRIVYGTGQIVEAPRILEMASALLTKPEVSYIHVRSASNNCYQCRIDEVNVA